MNIQSVQCNHCGAELEISPTTRFATCAHCGSRLAVVRSESAAYTELAEQVGALNQRMQVHLDRTELRDALEDLDRQWERERETFMVSNKHGVKHIPTRSESAIAGTVITIFGVVWTIMALGMAGLGGGLLHEGGFGPAAMVPCVFPAFGVLFMGLGIYQSMNAYDKAVRYEKAKERYHARRHALESNGKESA